jgi:hypothetical protein
MIPTPEMKFLFLDIDGVLNTHDYCSSRMSSTIHRGKVDLLNDILRATQAKVVLSSAWRYFVFRKEMNLAGLDWLLRSHGMLAGHLIGHTREDRDVDQPAAWTGDVTKWLQSEERGKQIFDWLIDHAPEGTPYKYVVIDDLDIGISAYGHPFIQTDSNVGLLKKHVKAAIRMLEETTT